MANKDFPSGLRPYSEGGSGRPRMKHYAVGNSTTIYANAPVVRQADGTVAMTASTTNIDDIVGVAAHYVATGASTTDTVAVWDDPVQLFIIQSVTGQTPAATDIFGNCDISNPNAGNTTTRQSTAEADTSTIDTTATRIFRIVDKVDRIDNDWGEHVDLVVQFLRGRHANHVDTGI